MRGFIVRGTLLGLPALALILAGAWLWWSQSGPASAWTVDEPRQAAIREPDGQAVRASFRLRNTSDRPLKVLGASTC